MTEDEAKTKWCPFVRVVASAKGRPLEVPPGQPGFNRIESADQPEVVTSYPGSALCIASACMAWRATPRARDNSVIIEAIRDHIAKHGCDVPTAADAVRAQLERQEAIADGYCGLAGAPQ